MLELNAVSKIYREPEGGDLHALSDISAKVDAGDFVAVYGPSGCGKSTLLLTAGGLLQPSCGNVRVDGEDIYALSGERRADLRARRIGFVFQQFHLIPYLSVLENVMVPAINAGSNDTAERARALLEQFGMLERLEHRPGELSTGERQRTAMARALLNGPKILLADEPTGNLDEANGAAVLEYLSDFARQGGAVLLVTHDQSARRFADRTLMLEKGRIVETVTREPSA